MPIVVIVLHTSLAQGLAPDGGAESFVRLAIMRFSEMAVPVFFFISGFLFFGKLEENWDWKIYGHIHFADKLLQKGKIRVNRTLSEASFFVYAVHPVLILELSNFILWRTLPFANAPVCFIKVFLRPALATLICLSVFLIMRKFTPRTLSLLTGSRCGSTR